MNIRVISVLLVLISFRLQGADQSHETEAYSDVTSATNLKPLTNSLGYFSILDHIFVIDPPTYNTKITIAGILNVLVAHQSDFNEQQQKMLKSYLRMFEKKFHQPLEGVDLSNFWPQAYKDLKQQIQQPTPLELGHWGVVKQWVYDKYTSLQNTSPTQAIIGAAGILATAGIIAAYLRARHPEAQQIAAPAAVGAAVTKYYSTPPGVPGPSKPTPPATSEFGSQTEVTSILEIYPGFGEEYAFMHATTQTEAPGLSPEAAADLEETQRQLTQLAQDQERELSLEIIGNIINEQLEKQLSEQQRDPVLIGQDRQEQQLTSALEELRDLTKTIIQQEPVEETAPVPSSSTSAPTETPIQSEGFVDFSELDNLFQNIEWEQ